MRLTVAVVMFVSAVQVFAQGFPSYDAVHNSPRTVVDYFLLCPAFRLDDNGQLTFSREGGGVDPGEFDDKKNMLTSGYKAGDFTVQSAIVDIANAYIRVTGVQDDLPFTLTFVFFDRKGKSNLPAFSYYSEGGDGETYVFQMFEIDSSREWQDVTQRVLPDFSLGVFDKSPDKPDTYPEVDWEYVLPRKGTTVLAIPHMTYKMGETGRPADQFQLVKRLLGHSLELPWDRNNGVFKTGGVE